MLTALRSLTIVIFAACTSCTAIYDFDRPLRLPDGSPPPCEIDEDCDDQVLCTLVVCRDMECVIPPGGDTRDKDNDTFVDVFCGGDDCDDETETIHPDAEELCNGVDDDCSGTVDDGETIECALGAPDQPCTTPCGSFGVQHCTTSCEWECEVPAEVCNGVDDDCDGTCDEGESCCAGELLDCLTDCDSTGTQVCSGDCQIPVSCDPPVESCNGIDDDCDEIIDNPDEIRITDAPYYTWRPSLVWTGSEYGLAWIDSRDNEGTVAKLYFARLDEAGRIIPGSERNLSTPEWAANDPVLLWTGEEFLVLFQDPPWLTPSVPDGFYLTRLDETGEPIDTNIPLIVDGVASAGLSAVWTGDSIGIAFHDYRDVPLTPTIYFARFSSEGEPIGEATRIDDTDDASAWATLAWTGEVYAVVWEDGRGVGNELFMTTLDSNGQENWSEDIAITNTEYVPLKPNLIWVEENSVFALVWHESWAIVLADVLFLLVETDGSPVGEEGPLVLNDHGQYAVRPDVAWMGSEFAVAWQRGDDDDQDIYAVRVSDSGEELGEEIIVSNANSLSGFVDLAWTGSKLALVWQDDRDDDCESRDVPTPCINWDELYFATNLCWPGS